MPTPSGADSPQRIAVIGGGISGLAAAHRLLELAKQADKPLRMTLFEASDRLGGTIQTKRIGDYLVELGADSFITNKPWALDLCRRLGIEDRLLATDARYRRSLVLRKGRPVPVPEGFLLISPARIRPVLTSPLFTPWGKLRMGLEYFIPRRRAERDESLASFVRRRFGSQALDRLVQPLVGGIYTADPEKLSLKATMPRFLEMEREHGSLIRASRKALRARRGRKPEGTDPEADASGSPGKESGKESGARYGLFTVPEGGLNELLQRLTARIGEHVEIRLGARVEKLAFGRAAGVGPRVNTRKLTHPARQSLTHPARQSPAHPAGWSLTLADGTVREFDAVVVALPSYVAAGLLEGVDTETARLLREIPYASAAVHVSGHRLHDVRHPLDAFGLVIPYKERRKVLAVSFSSRKFPGRAPEGRVLLRTFLGGAMQPEMLEHSDEELKAVVGSELSEMLGVTGEPDFCLLTRYANAMPQYHLGHVQLVDEIERRAGALPGLALAGNAYRGVGIPDCIHSGQRAAEAVFSAEA